MSREPLAGIEPATQGLEHPRSSAELQRQTPKGLVLLLRLTHLCKRSVDLFKLTLTITLTRSTTVDVTVYNPQMCGDAGLALTTVISQMILGLPARSEERRVGKECRS